MSQMMNQTTETMIQVTNLTKVDCGWGRYNLPAGQTAGLPRRIAETLLGNHNFKVYFDAISNQSMVHSSHLPKVFIDDGGHKHGGIMHHNRSIRKHCNAIFVDSIENADVRHWHFGGSHLPTDIATCHGYYTDRFLHIHQEIGRKINTILQVAFSQSRQVISVSNWVAHDIKEKWGVDSIVIPNCVDPAEFWNDDYGDYILWSSYECPEKNPADAFRIAELLPEYQFIGLTNQHDKWPKLKNMTLLEYPQPHDVVKQLMSKARLILCTSLQEAGPIFILEGFASSKGVVAYEANGPAELVTHKKDGLLATQGDVKKMADNIRRMWPKAETYGTQARKTALRYSGDVVWKPLTRLYHNMRYPSVSVIVLAYNNRETLQKTFDSIPEWVQQIVIGDTDGTHADLVPQSPRFQYMKIRNVSPAVNRNELLKHATGEYVTILDGDDFRFPGTLEAQLKYMLENSIDATCAACYRNGEVLWKQSQPEVLSDAKWPRGNLAPHCSIVVKRSLLMELDYYDPALDYCEDYDLAWRIAKKTTFVRLPLVAYHWTFNPTGRSRDPKFEAEYLAKVRKKNG